MRHSTAFALAGLSFCVLSACDDARPASAPAPYRPPVESPATAEPVAHAPVAPVAHTPEPAHPSPNHPAVHWTYEGAEGPEHWGDLDPAFALCKTGKGQTPVDLRKGAHADAKLSPLAFAYQPIPLQILNNGHTIQVEDTTKSSLTVLGSTWKLLQFHAHASSEHTVDQKSFAFEIHFVHKNDKGNLAVLGVLFDVGKENAVLAPYFDHAPKEKGPATRVEGKTIDLGKLFGPKAAYYHYQGSLTTPPCTEGVEWFVLQEIQQISAAQLAKFTTIEHGPTHRPVQALGQRDLAAFKP